MTKEYYDFEQWYSDLVILFIENKLIREHEVDTLDKMNWVDACDDGLTPEEVLEFELENWNE